MAEQRAGGFDDVREALASVLEPDKAARFDEEDLRLLKAAKLTAEEDLRLASREGLEKAGLAPGRVELLLRAKGRSQDTDNWDQSGWSTEECDRKVGELVDSIMAPIRAWQRAREKKHI